MFASKVQYCGVVFQKPSISFHHRTHQKLRWTASEEVQWKAEKEVKLIHFDTLKRFHSFAMNDSPESKGQGKEADTESCVDRKL